MKKPRVLYKYQNFCTQTLMNLKASSLYFSSPKRFNDPYDYDLVPNVKDPTNKELEYLRKYLLEHPSTQSKHRREITTYSVSRLKELLKNIATNHYREMSSSWPEYGVTCFSECNNDLLMWAHYGGGYKGFCLEFSTEYPPFNRAIKVNYRDALPKLDITSVLLRSEPYEILNIFSTKSNSWSYEREWRCIHEKEGTLFTYELEALKAVYFGPEIERQQLEILCLILMGQNKEVELWRGKRSIDAFSVIFERFSYTSYVEAKGKGLV